MSTMAKLVISLLLRVCGARTGQRVDAEDRLDRRDNFSVLLMSC